MSVHVRQVLSEDEGAGKGSRMGSRRGVDSAVAPVVVVTGWSGRPDGGIRSRGGHRMNARRALAVTGGRKPCG